MERLRRLQEVIERAPIYFITACAHGRRAVVASDAMHETFKSFASSGPDQGAWVGGYVLMPDHLHLFVAIDDTKTNLSEWMKALKGMLSQTLRKSGMISPFWQKGFFDHLLRSDESYSAKWDYVRNNPVRAGLVSNADEWLYLGEVFDLEYRRDRV
jgi:putative transposase